MSLCPGCFNNADMSYFHFGRIPSAVRTSKRDSRLFEWIFVSAVWLGTWQYCLLPVLKVNTELKVEQQWSPWNITINMERRNQHFAKCSSYRQFNCWFQHCGRSFKKHSQITTTIVYTYSWILTAPSTLYKTAIHQLPSRYCLCPSSLGSVYFWQRENPLYCRCAPSTFCHKLCPLSVFHWVTV